MEWRGLTPFMYKENDKVEWRKNDGRERDKNKGRQKEIFYTILSFPLFTKVIHLFCEKF